MHLNTPALTAAAVVSLLILSACNKSANVPATPAVATAPATTTPATGAPAAPMAANPSAMPAPTAGGRTGGHVRQACAADIAKFCAAGEKPGKCLRAHQSALSQACQTAWAERKAARQARMGGAT
ncbi:MAG: hypothetical protein M3T55_01770 [Pseudomonadota bacterium]|nr:hypothetical protein [Pseudomonadota bacterium]